MAEKRISWFLLTSFWIFVRQKKIAITRPIFQIFANFFSTWASLCVFHICFWEHSNPTWNDWDMVIICSAGFFAPRPWIVSSGPPWIGLVVPNTCFESLTDPYEEGRVSSPPIFDSPGKIIFIMLSKINTKLASHKVTCSIMHPPPSPRQLMF